MFSTRWRSERQASPSLAPRFCEPLTVSKYKCHHVSESHEVERVGVKCQLEHTRTLSKTLIHNGSASVAPNGFIEYRDSGKPSSLRSTGGKRIRLPPPKSTVNAMGDPSTVGGNSPRRSEWLQIRPSFAVNSHVRRTATWELSYG